MFFYLLLIIVFGVVILASVATLIYGLIKNRKNLLITAVILFAIGTIGCAFSALTYTKKVVNYVRSDEFQSDTKKGSELIGQTIGSASSGVSSGLATTLDDEATTKLARKTGTIIGKSIKTVASGFDSTVGNRNIYLDSSLSDGGLELGRAEEKYNSKNNDLQIFIEYKKPFKGKLRVTNFDQNGRKIDIADKEINSKEGDGKVEVFSFPHSKFGMTTYYIVSKVG
jgi:hypothetical protein